MLEITIKENRKQLPGEKTSRTIFDETLSFDNSNSPQRSIELFLTLLRRFGCRAKDIEKALSNLGQGQSCLD